MLEVKFEIDGRPVSADNLADAFEAATLSCLENHIRNQLQGVRDPDTGAFPIVAVRGHSLDNLSLHVSGSDKLLALVNERLGIMNECDAEETMTPEKTPKAFLCHASEDKDIVRRIAEDFHSNGIEAFFDEWEIGPGESIRQKIDEGLSDCTHFIVLLSPQSILKTWVNAEMDGGFFRKMEGRCAFIPLRLGLTVGGLPPLLKGLHSPLLEDYDQDLNDLINFIHGVARRPPIKKAPPVIENSSRGALGVSPAAEAVVRYLVDKTNHGLFMDPSPAPEDIQSATGLGDDDLIDAMDELYGLGFVRLHHFIGSGKFDVGQVSAEAALFVEFDKPLGLGDPAADALIIAADLVNGDEATGNVQALAEKHEWQPRRINPAISYLMENDLVRASEGLGSAPWRVHWIDKTPNTRRFVQSKNP